MIELKVRGIVVDTGRSSGAGDAPGVASLMALEDIFAREAGVTRQTGERLLFRICRSPMC